MSTENEFAPAAERSEATTATGPHAGMGAVFAALGVDPHQFHGTAVDGEAKAEDSESGCPYARFFSGLFGSDKG